MVSTLENRKRGVKSFIFTLYKYLPLADAAADPKRIAVPEGESPG